MLRDLLVQAIDECAAVVGRAPTSVAAFDPALWISACRRTGATRAADPTT
jgi:hypothetical protein